MQCDIGGAAAFSDGRSSRDERSSSGIFWMEYIEGGSKTVFMFTDNERPTDPKYANFHLVDDPSSYQWNLVLEDASVINEGIYGCVTSQYDLRWNVTVTSKYLAINTFKCLSYFSLSFVHKGGPFGSHHF